MSSVSVTPDPYASIAKPIQADPYASIAKPISGPSQDIQAHPEGFWNGLQDYVEHPEQRGAGQPNALNRFAGGIVQTVGQVAQHPLDAAGSAASAILHQTPLALAVDPQGAIDSNPIVSTYRDAKQNGIAAATGHLIGGTAVGTAVGMPVEAAIGYLPKGETSVSGQTYAPSHAAAFEGAIAAAPAMGKNFIPQNVTPEALTPIRNTAARMAQGNAIDQGTVHAATAASTPPLQRVAAYQRIVQGALGDLEQQHAPALAQVSNVPVDTSELVKALQAKISPTMDAADASAVRNLIQRVRQAKTIGDLNTFRQQLNVETAPEYKQSQVQAGRSGLSAQATSDLAGIVRDAYYDNLQKATGKDFTPLKRQEANLITTQEALQNQQSKLATSEATFAAPTTLREKAGQVANLIKEPKTTVSQTILRESPATKIATLLQKSLTDLEPAPTSTGVPAPPTPNNAQPLLPAQSGGAYPMPSGSAAALTPDEQVAAIMHEIRQRRTGQPLGLPAQSGARTILPNNFDTMSPGEQSAALMHLLRTARQAALPANASPIRLPPR